MAPKKSKATKASLKKAGTMAATAAAGQEFLKQAWGEDKLNRVNALLNARDKSDASTDSEADTAGAATATTTTTTTASSSAASKTKAKPKLSKARTMKSTAKEGTALIGKQALGDTRAETNRRQAAVKAKKALQEVTKPTTTRKSGLKRLGTMANTAREGKAYIKRNTGSKKGKSTTGRKRVGGRTKKPTN